MACVVVCHGVCGVCVMVLVVVVLVGGCALQAGGRSVAAVGGAAGAGLEAHPGAAGGRVEGRDREGLGPVSRPTVHLRATRLRIAA